MASTLSHFLPSYPKLLDCIALSHSGKETSSWRVELRYYDGIFCFFVSCFVITVALLKKCLVTGVGGNLEAVDYKQGDIHIQEGRREMVSKVRLEHERASMV